jgi:TorA maturation chaperone TorD
MQEARDDIYKIMHREHLEVDPALHVPEDHISFEMEFMGQLCVLLTEALRTGDFPEAHRLTALQRTVHKNHLLNWIDRFCDDIETCCRTRFYRGVGKMTKAFIYLDEELIADIEDSLTGV